MEKDSFESQLRSTVLRAELTINQSSDKERVWNAIHKKKRDQRKFYYAVAAVAIMFFSFALYFNQEQEIIPIKKEFTVKKTTSGDSLEEKGKQVKTAILPSIKKLHSITKTQLKKETNVALNLEKIVAMPEQEAVIVIKNPIIVPVVQNDAIVNNQAIEPPFTVVFKRGVSTVNSINEGLIYTTLKKFKLKRDTTYFANAEEKQSTKFKLSFKKEN